MKIQIDGVGTKNKGAELMLYATLEQIEKNEPNSEVFINSYSVSLSEIHSGVILKKRFALKFGDYPNTIANKFGLPIQFLTTEKALRGLHVVFDASGFKFGDQWSYPQRYLSRLENYYSTLNNYGTKIIMLPQAYGPFETKEGKKCANILSKYCDLIIARDEISAQHLKQADIDGNKILVYSDFTNLIKGTFTNGYEYLNGGVCFIPSVKMITKTGIEESEYINFFSTLIYETIRKGKKPFLLNHEGKGDYLLCKKINQKVNRKIALVHDLNAKQIKGIIGKSYLTVSSRYHGVSNSLSQGVPCLATTWSHKYKMLFDDYKVEKSILDINDTDKSIALFKEYMVDDKNMKFRKNLKINGDNIRKNINNMWMEVWGLVQS